MTTTPKTVDQDAYLALIDARVSGAAKLRPVVRPISLKPALYADREAAILEVNTQIGLAGREGAAPPKMNGSPLEKARKRVEAIEQEIRDTTIVVTLRPKDGPAMTALFKAFPDDQAMVDWWAHEAAELFESAATPDGTPLPGITQDKIRPLIAALPFGELNAIHREIEAAQEAPDFHSLATQ